MVGDSYETDIAGALRSGLNAILVRKNNEKDYPLYTKELINVVSLSLDIFNKNRKLYSTMCKI